MNRSQTVMQGSFVQDCQIDSRNYTPQQDQYEHPVDPTLLMETRQSWPASVSTQQPYTKLPSHVFCLRWVGNVCL